MLNNFGMDLKTKQKALSEVFIVHTSHWGDTDCHNSGDCNQRQILLNHSAHLHAFGHLLKVSPHEKGLFYCGLSNQPLGGYNG